VTGPASSVERPPFTTEIPVGDPHRLEFSADTAGLPPLSVSELAPGVDALVGDGVDEEEVVEGVVLLVAVDVVDLEAFGLGTVDGFPGCDVSELESSVHVASEIALAGDVLSIRSASLWSSLSHADSLLHSPLSR
jgi:hypothetical protein